MELGFKSMFAHLKGYVPNRQAALPCHELLGLELWFDGTNDPNGLHGRRGRKRRKGT